MLIIESTFLEDSKPADPLVPISYWPFAVCSNSALCVSCRISEQLVSVSGFSFNLAVSAVSSFA